MPGVVRGYYPEIIERKDVENRTILIEKRKQRGIGREQEIFKLSDLSNQQIFDDTRTLNFEQFQARQSRREKEQIT